MYAILICLFLSSCASKVAGHQIVGVWEHEGNVIEFCTDGTFKKGKEKYKFSVTEDKVTIDNKGEAMVIEYAINSNGTLTMNGLIYYPVTK
ncbi:MAG: hypothetical protein E7574_02395 [Ruminococcaceae bacterium]|nr:hypothetical protein [Oscillospiraceae bacterium]